MAYDLITILGPTASGKTALAVSLADRLDSEIISADSRQIYKGMTIGTGKDLSEYTIGNKQIPYHLIDIRNAGEKYNIFEFQHDFFHIYGQIKSRSRLPVLCGGSGLYIESVLNAYRLLDVPANPKIRENLKDKPLDELSTILQSYKKIHNSTDLDSTRRAIRAIEIEEYYKNQAPCTNEFEPLNSLIIGVSVDREIRRQKITARLIQRLEEGMIDEVRNLLDSGILPEDLIYYGLEYKFLTLYLTGQLNYNEMFDKLEIAIHQFAKRQMTWFRGMEKKGFKIHWIDALVPIPDRTEQICKLIVEDIDL